MEFRLSRGSPKDPKHNSASGFFRGSYTLPNKMARTAFDFEGVGCRAREVGRFGITALAMETSEGAQLFRQYTPNLGRLDSWRSFFWISAMEHNFSTDHPFPGLVRVEYRVNGEIVYVEWKRDELRFLPRPGWIVRLMSWLLSVLP